MPYPRTEVDANIQLAADQAFAEQQGVQRNFTNLVIKSANQLSNITDNAFRLQQELVGAKATGVLLMDPLAKDILDQRSAGGQPQAAGGPSPQGATTPAANKAA